MFRIKIVEFNPQVAGTEKTLLEREADWLAIPEIVAAAFKEQPKPRKPRTAKAKAAA